MKSHRSLLILTLAALFGLTLGGCISDAPGSGDAAPAFSAESIDFGRVVCGELSPMARLKIYNRSGSNMRLRSISLDNPDGAFRMNVDGIAGTEFADVDLRAGDSIYVFIDCLIDAGTRTEDFAVAGAVAVDAGGGARRVPLSASAVNAIWLRDARIETSTTLGADRPYAVSGALTVAPGAELTLAAGCRLLFASGARMDVEGALTAHGTPEAPVELLPTRSGALFEGADYSIVPGQWAGVRIAAGASAVNLEGVRVRGTTYGLAFDPGACADDGATLLNCLMHTATNTVVSAADTDLALLGCCLSEGGAGIVALGRGSHRIAQCTLANSYPFGAPSGPVLDFTEPTLTRAEVDNSILWGSGGLLLPASLDNTAIYLRSVLLGTTGTDDAHFIGCIWDTDPMFAIDEETYTYDYRLLPGSPAIGAGSAALLPAACRTDLTGRLRRADAPALGAYAAPD